MKLLPCILLIALFSSCGSKKKFAETYQEDTSRVVESLAKIDIDTSKVVTIEDNNEVVTEITVTEFEPVRLRDTIVSVPIKITVKKTSTGQNQVKTDRQSGVSSMISKDHENLKTVIDRQTESEQDPYDPKWIRYLFWILFLIAVIAGVIWLKKYLKFL